MQTVPVALGGRSYSIHIGQDLLAQAGTWIRPQLAGRQVFLIADTTALAHHGDALLAGLEGMKVQVLPVAAGEASKSLATYSDLVLKILDQSPERGDLVVAFGGGVVGDLAGFVAASVLRGLGLIQIPTTLLAQVDSSVGGKTGINAPQGKNLIGAFYQPKLVLIDLQTLQTLADRDMRAGYAEVVKYALIDQPDFFDWLEVHGPAILAHEPAALAQAIATSCTAKARVVVADEREGGRRALLNLGHTFAHAFEAAGAYDGRILHGEAVSLGLVCAFDLSHRLGLAHGQDVARLRRHLAALGLPTHLTDFPAIDFDLQNLWHAMARDKKVQGGTIRFVLAHGIGHAFLSDGADTDAVTQTLHHMRTGAGNYACDDPE